MAEQLSPALRAVSDAVLAVASNLEIEQVLQRLVDVSRGLVHARYAALGIPNGEGGFAQFLTAGMDEELIARLGPLPETHGLLGAMLEGLTRIAPPTSSAIRASAAGGRAAIRTCARSSACRSAPPAR